MNTVKSVIHRKIKKDVARGLAFIDIGEIHIDERLKGLEHLEILIHEILHIQNPKWSESKIISMTDWVKKVGSIIKSLLKKVIRCFLPKSRTS